MPHATEQVPGLGISSFSGLFTDFGYQQRSPSLIFPAKKLEAYWYSPPEPSLPRIFISEIKAGPARPVDTAGVP